MKIIKLALISAVILFALVSALALLLPAHVVVSRAIDINAPGEKVTSYVGDLREWGKWNVFVKRMDSLKTIRSTGADMITAGELEINVVDRKRDSVITAWKDKNKSIVHSSFSFIPSGNVTTVHWYFEFHVNWYPWEKFHSIILDKEMGPSMEGSLINLKQIVETSQ